MRIVENSVSRLALKDRTLWIAAVCFLAAGFMISQAVAHHQPINFYFALFVVATFGLAFLQMTDVVFDKTHRVATLRKFTVIRLKRTTFHFDDIVDVTVQIAPQPGDADSITCRLAFRTQDAVIPMTAGYEPGLERHNAMRDVILRALDRVPETADPVRQLAKAGRIIDAVVLLRQRENLDLATARERVARLQKERSP
jgi:hypothetical protein